MKESWIYLKELASVNNLLSFLLGWLICCLLYHVLGRWYWAYKTAKARKMIKQFEELDKLLNALKKPYDKEE